MGRGERNSLGALSYIPGVERIHRRRDGVVVVMFTDGTMFRVRSMNAHQLRAESERMSSRASVLMALAIDKQRGNE